MLGFNLLKEGFHRLQRFQESRHQLLLGRRLFFQRLNEHQDRHALIGGLELGGPSLRILDLGLREEAQETQGRDFRLGGFTIRLRPGKRREEEKQNGQPAHVSILTRHLASPIQDRGS